MTDFVTRLENELHDAALRRERAGVVRRVALPRGRESIRAFQTHVRSVPVDPQASTLAAGVDETEIDREVLQQEQALALRAGLAELPAQRRALLELLVADPTVPYDEISRVLDIPVGSIGPTRARALNQLRNTRAVRAWTESAPAGGQEGA